MAYYARENVVVTKLLTYIRGHDTFAGKYNSRTCLYVPDFVYLPGNFSGYCLQCKAEVSPYGMGGGAYLQRMDLEFALLYRCNVDPIYEFEKTVTTLNEEAYSLRQHILDWGSANDLGTDGTGGSNEELTIRLFDSGQRMSPKPVFVDGALVKECIWIGFKFWGMYPLTLSDVIA